MDSSECLLLNAVLEAFHPDKNLREMHFLIIKCTCDCCGGKASAVSIKYLLLLFTFCHLFFPVRVYV